MKWCKLGPSCSPCQPHILAPDPQCICQLLIRGRWDFHVCVASLSWWPPANTSRLPCPRTLTDLTQQTQTSPRRTPAGPGPYRAAAAHSSLQDRATHTCPPASCQFPPSPGRTSCLLWSSKLSKPRLHWAGLEVQFFMYTWARKRASVFQFPLCTHLKAGPYYISIFFKI